MSNIIILQLSTSTPDRYRFPAFNNGHVSHWKDRPGRKIGLSKTIFSGIAEFWPNVGCRLHALSVEIAFQSAGSSGVINGCRADFQHTSSKVR